MEANKPADTGIPDQESMNSSASFSYTYSAPQQDEVKKIRQKYLPKEESILDQLKRLDRSATRKGQALSLVTGMLGTLVFGIGMSCCLVGTGRTLLPGIVIGCIGMIAAATAYPIFTKVTKRERERIAPEILRLTDELLKLH